MRHVRIIIQMARPQSIAIGGYYKTPTHLLPYIASLFSAKDLRGDASCMDPCAGDGEAIISLCSNWGINTFYTCEMEESRYKTLYEALKAKYYYSYMKSLHGDAFNISFAKSGNSGVSVLYLNPPYDFDREHGRLEHKFLQRFSSALVEGGLLIFLVPYYALKASAEFLAKEYTDLHCFRLPDEDFAVFKQVVLIAKKRHPLFEANPIVQKQVVDWSDAGVCPDITSVTSPILNIPKVDSYDYLNRWEMTPLDTSALISKFIPWTQTARLGKKVEVSNILPNTDIGSLLSPSYPVVTAPRPAHIAAGIASGLFNGARITSEAQHPPLLIKGVFDKEYITIEEKYNKDGSVKAQVQIQQPKLVTTVLNLDTYKYHTLDTSTMESGSDNVSDMTVSDILKNYGSSMYKVMEKQCPIFYDPRKDSEAIELAPSTRKLYDAQAHCSKALVKLFRSGKKAAFLLGEIGSGKSTVALVTAKTVGSIRPLIMCPPHLLESWANEAKSVFPGVEFRVISDISDIEKLASVKTKNPIISVLSRESAKLHHGWEGVGEYCPKCNQPTPSVDLAKKRARCSARTRYPIDPIAKFCVKLSRKLSKYDPTNDVIQQLAFTRIEKVGLVKQAAKEVKPVYTGMDPLDLKFVIDTCFDIIKKDGLDNFTKDLLVLSLFLLNDDSVTEAVFRKLNSSLISLHYYDTFIRDLLGLLPLESDVITTLSQEYNHDNLSSWDKFIKTLGEVNYKLGSLELSFPSKGQSIAIQYETSPKGLRLDGLLREDVSLAYKLLRGLTKFGKFGQTKECGEFLYQAIPKPRRVSLAKFITSRYPKIFDFLVIDESHEVNTEGSAQEKAAHRLQLLGIPTILQTGSVMNGYAESMFTNMWYSSPDFREEFDRDEIQRFIDRYGYRKRIIEEKDRKATNIVAFGSNSDRVMTEKVCGNAPGVLPLFVLRHLLRISVTLHKSDLSVDIPKCTQEKVNITPTPELLRRFSGLQNTLIQTIKADRFKPEVSGKLFGQLVELPSYLDRATSDVGNCESGDYEIRYPESAGSDLITSLVGLVPSTILPKEEWMLSRIKSELDGGRCVLVFTWHTSLLSRYSKLLEEYLGEPVPVLYADKVAAGKRQAWIDKEIISKKRRVMITNPVAVQTGLNNLVHFSTEIWMENPACNPVIYRQAVGRVDRIGQKKETRILLPVYTDTLQDKMYDLLMRKIAISVATDGLDPESALQAAGLGDDDYLIGLSIGKQLWSILNQD